MSFENPLDKIKKMNANNIAKAVEQEKIKEEKEEQETMRQQDVDNEYFSLQREKIKSLDENNPLALKILKIASQKGLVEDKIKEVHEEAEKNPDTLKYFEENKNELMFSFYDELERLKTEQEDNELVEKIILRENDKKIDSLYPKTTAGKEEILEKKKENVEILWKEVTQYTDGRDNEFFGKTFDEIQKKLSIDEIQELLENQKELKSLQSDPFIVNEKWDRKEFNNWQEGNLEEIRNSEKILNDKYNELIATYSEGKSELLKYNIPTLGDLVIKDLGYRSLSIDLSGGFDEINSITNRFGNDNAIIDENIRETEGTFLKRGLKKLKQEKSDLKIKEENFKNSEPWGKLCSFRDSLSKDLFSFYEKINETKKVPHVIENKIKGKKISDMFEILQEDKSFTQEENSLIEREGMLNEKIKQFEEKVKA